jgi:hypothetical protein
MEMVAAPPGREKENKRRPSEDYRRGAGAGSARSATVSTR